MKINRKMKTTIPFRITRLVPLLLLTGLIASCNDNKEELEVIRKEAEASRKTLEAMQRTERLKNENQAQRNMESYFN